MSVMAQIAFDEEATGCSDQLSKQTKKQPLRRPQVTRFQWRMTRQKTHSPGVNRAGRHAR
jgi:hypothetical protein